MEGRYKKFKIGDLFIAETGDTDLQQTDINGQGDYFINSGLQNLGIKGKTDRKAKIFPKNTITIDFWGNAFYRPFNYKLATHNHVFSLSGDIIRNEKVGLYLTAQMSYLRKFYSFNNMGTWNKIKENFIDLPVTEKEDIDFPYIEERVRELEEERVRELEAYLEACGFEDCELTEEETKTLENDYLVQQKKIGVLFDIHPTKAYKFTNRILCERIGTSRLVSNTSNNNGITNYIDFPTTEKGNMITYSDTTTSDGIFYQPFPFVGYSHVQGLYPFEEQHWNENTLLYFVTLFRKSTGGRFDYANKFNRKIAAQMEVSLPVTTDGSIDYHFMETYINAIKKECIARLKRYIDKEHKAYTKVIEA